MTKLQATKRLNGQMAVTVKVQHHLTHEDAALHLANSNWLHGNPPNRGHAWKLIKNELRNHGESVDVNYGSYTDEVFDERMEIARHILAEDFQEPFVEPTCWCRRCADGVKVGIVPLGMIRMFLCPDCGNKRCPRATCHLHACTDSNEPGQPGSAYV